MQLHTEIVIENHQRGVEDAGRSLPEPNKTKTQQSLLSLIPQETVPANICTAGGLSMTAPTMNALRTGFDSL